MSSFAQRFFRNVYRRTASPETLPWHRAFLPPFVAQALDERSGEKLDVLDLGCGAGTYSVEMAKKGHRVTGLDFVPEALTLARGAAQKAGVTVEWVQADVTRWKAPGTYGLILDAGCLHSLPWTSLGRYRERLLEWLAPGGSYVLLHFEKRDTFDWRPFGPRRLHRETLLRYFAPELRMHAHTVEGVTRPGETDPWANLGSFWFRKPSASSAR